MSGGDSTLRSAGDAAVDEQRLAGHEVGSAAGEKNRSAKDIRWLLKAAKLYAAQQSFGTRRIRRHRALDEFSHRRGRGERIDANAERCPLCRQRCGEMRDRRLRGAVDALTS